MQPRGVTKRLGAIAFAHWADGAGAMGRKVRTGIEMKSKP
jgi:hypothetical protein